MAKLQSIKRINGSTVFSVNIPIEKIEELEWEKGDELDIELIDDSPPSYGLTIYKK